LYHVSAKESEQIENKVKSYAGDLLRRGGKDVPPNGSDFSLRRGAAA
jgi:hypothetical protein